MPNFFTSLVGSKPQVPGLSQLNLGTEASKATAANQANLPGAEALTSAANLFSQDQITQMLNRVIPGFSGLSATASGNIESELQGQIPKDVQDAIARSDAATSLSSGTGGTQFSRNLVARDLGLTSLDLTNRGLASAESWTKTMASLYEPSQMNVSSMFINPMQQYQTDNEQNMQQFQRQWMQNQISAMPAPWANDLKQFVYRAMSAYSGTPVDNPYSHPASSGGLGGGGGLDSSGFEGGGGGYSTSFSDSSGGLGMGGGGEGGAMIGADGGGGGGIMGML